LFIGVFGRDSDFLKVDILVVFVIYLYTKGIALGSEGSYFCLKGCSLSLETFDLLLERREFTMQSIHLWVRPIQITFDRQNILLPPGLNISFVPLGNVTLTPKLSDRSIDGRPQ
jgi:hypothetical protein